MTSSIVDTLLLKSRRRESLDITYWLWAALGLLVAAFVAHCFMTVMSSGGQSSPFDAIATAGMEVGAAAICLVVARQEGDRPSALTILGLGVSAWAAGDATATIHRLAIPALSPWAPTVLHAAFYPLIATGLILFVHHELGRAQLAEGLDGLIGGLGVAAACAAFTFHTLPHYVPGNMSATVTGIVYPVGNAVLAALAGGTLAAISGRRGLPAVILGIGILLNVIGVTTGLFEKVTGASSFGSILVHLALPAGLLVIAAAASLTTLTYAVGSYDRHAEYVLPNLAAAGALTIQFVDVAVGVNRVALLFATLTLLAAGIRLFFLLRHTQAISDLRQELAATDELTGLWNRRHLFRVLDTYFTRLAAGATNSPLAFLFVDLNRFKEINDSFGHPAGDELLKLLATRLRGSLRDSDILARLGGDEFAVVLPGIDVEGAVAVALRVTSCLEHPFKLDRVNVGVGASIGIAMAPTDAQSSESLLWRADTAMYRAKMEKNNIACYEETVDVESDRMRLLEELRVAILEDELTLYYQPQLDLTTEAVAGVEALMRWNHPRLGLLAPVNFLSVAEESGEISSVTRWVLDRALAQLDIWRSKGLELTVSVNISPLNLGEPDFLEMVSDALDRHGLPASALVLEITENWVVSEFDMARTVIRSLSELGITVSVDDFGAGATSLTYLRDLEAGELKLDRAFVTALDAEEGGRNLELVRSTIELGHAMGLRIVAEGVEDRATLNLLTKLGCDLAQGYHISKPKPPTELALRPKQQWRAA